MITSARIERTPSGDDETYIKTRLQPLFAKLDIRYSSNRLPAIQLRDGKEIALHIATYGTGTAFNFLARLLTTHEGGANTNDYTNELDDDFVGNGSAELFERTLERYLDQNLPAEYRVAAEAQLLTTCWAAVAFNPLLASQVMTDARITGSPVTDTLLLLARSALRQPLDLSILEDVITSLHRRQQAECTVLATRILRRVFYEYPELVSKDQVPPLLNMLAQEKPAYWGKFCLDIYLRSCCSFIRIPASTIKRLKETASSYRSAASDEVLWDILPFVELPLDQSRNHTLSTLTDRFVALAHKASDAIDARWCILAYARMLPLYDTLETEQEYGYSWQPILRAIDQGLVMASPALAFFAALEPLRVYGATKQLTELVQFENTFLKHKETLTPGQQASLQLEYAGALYHAVQFNNSDELTSLRFHEYCTLRQELIRHRLFSNTLLTDLTTSVPVPNLRRRALQGWLRSYAQLLFDLHLGPLLATNVAQIGQVKLTAYIYELRPRISKVIAIAVDNILSTPEHYRPEYLAKASAAFRFLNRQTIIPAVLAFLQRALEADDYTVTRNAKELAYSLYVCGYYGTPDERDSAITLAQMLAAKTAYQLPSRRMHWMYLTCLTYQKSTIEQGFLTALAAVIAGAPAKAKQLALKQQERFQLTFPDTVVDVVATWATKGSVFAQTLGAALASPEAWNVLGTTVLHNRKSDFDTEALERAAAFYSFAKCFVRERRENDQKYCYNYIRCTALLHRAQHTPPDTFFVQDTAWYLARPQANQFGHREACTKDYFEIVADQWHTLPLECRRNLLESMQKIEWHSDELTRVQRLSI